MDLQIEADDTAIILTGGLGSRLGDLTTNLPKPMLPVAGRPFVEYIVLQLRRSGFRRIIFASGYRSERLRDHFRSGHELGLEIRYSEESQPLGTGGAIRLAAQSAANGRVLVVNGDSFVDVDPRSVLDVVKGGIIVGMALTRVADAGRYGTVELSHDGSVTRFAQSGEHRGPGLINAGVYGVDLTLIDMIPPDRPCSLEREVLPALAGNRLHGVPSVGFFVDIGVPDSYWALVEDPSPLLRASGAGAVP